MRNTAVTDFSWFSYCTCVIPSEVEESLDVILSVARDYNFWIYVMTNKNHSVLYVGVTNRLSRRTWEHRHTSRQGFAADYRCTKLIYYEWYGDVRDAIARESQLKKWSRAKKVALINRLNPSWRDLGADVLQDDLVQEISRLRSK